MAIFSHPGASAADYAPPRASRWRVLWQFWRRTRWAPPAHLSCSSMIFMAAFADVVTVHDPDPQQFRRHAGGAEREYWLGTDQFGRDLYTRIVYGARTALLVGFVSAFVGATLGLVLGVASAYFGGRFDLIFQRIMDVLMAFPLVILALAVVSIFGTGTHNVILAITIPFIPRCARVVRSSALAVRETPFIDAARACGFSHTRIVLRHMVPNVMAPYLIMMTAAVGQAILIEASLSFLGLGVQEPVPAWGLMLRGGAQEYAESAPWVAIFPGIAISLAVFGFNLFGDALRDWLDPKLKTLIRLTCARQVRELAALLGHPADVRACEMLRIEQAALARGVLQHPAARAPRLLGVGAEGAAPERVMDLDRVVHDVADEQGFGALRVQRDQHVAGRMPRRRLDGHVVAELHACRRRSCPARPPGSAARCR